MRLRTSAKFWDVRISRPKTTTYARPDGTTANSTYAENTHVMVSSDEAISAMQLVVAEYPGATIHSCNMRGDNCAILIDDKVMP